jgi:hypothetical protein
MIVGYHLATSKDEEDIISVRQTLVIGGYLGCVGILICAIALVVMATPSQQEDSKYISEGMEAHCGWSVVMLGTCTFLICICQLVAAAHMNRHSAIVFSALQLLGWNIVLGIADTGWNLHYVGLVVFLVSNICYHWIASHDENYGDDKYRWVNRLTIIFTFFFGCAAMAVDGAGGYRREIKACAVSLEFVLCFFSMLENMCLVHALDAYRSIHMVFEKW